MFNWQLINDSITKEDKKALKASRIDYTIGNGITVG